MKALVKIIIVGAVILVLGIGVLVVALGINGWKVDGDYEMKTFECQDDNTTLDIEFLAGELEMQYYDGATIKIEYPESETWSASISEVNGTLKFATTNKRKWINFPSWLSKMPKTKIWIPQGDIMNMEMKINAGTVKLADGEYGNFDVAMNAGTFSIGNINCKKFALELNAGTINAQNIRSIEDASIEMNAGTINLQSLSCPSFECEVSAGSANINKIDTPIIDVEVSAGSVKLEIMGAKSDYNIAVEKSAGSCNVSNQNGNTNKSIKAEVSAGSLTVRFDD